MLQRTALIQEILTDPVNTHVLYGPSGYGKSVVLHQIAGQIDDAVTVEASRTVPMNTALLEAIERFQLGPLGHRDVQRALSDLSVRSPKLTVLVSQAYAWHDVMLSELITLARETRSVRWVIELRSLNVQGLQSALLTRQIRAYGPERLRITDAELQQWQPQLTDHDRQVLAPFDGWPLAAAGFTEAFFNAARLFEDLVAAVPPEDRAQLLRLRTVQDWQAMSVTHPALGDRLVRMGMPVHELRGTFVPQPALIKWISERPPGESMSGFDDVYMTIQTALRSVPRNMAQALRLAEEHVRWADLTRQQRSHLLDLFASVGPDELSPALRDHLADAAERLGKLEITTLLVSKQRASGQATFRTMDTYMRMLLRRNDYLHEFNAALKEAAALAVTPHDHFRHTLLTAQGRVVQLDGEGALVAAKQMLRYTESQFDRIMQAHEYEIQAYVMLGDSDSVQEAYQRAVALAEAFGNVAALRHIRVIVADFLKDRGLYQLAGDMIQAAFPAGAAERGKNSDYAEVQRGMILMEMGEYGRAIEHLKHARDLFENNRGFVGIIMPVTYHVFCLYAQNPDGADVSTMQSMTDMLKRYVRMYWADTPPGSTEAASFYPLAEGALLLAQGRYGEAVARLESIRTEGAESYDSVLLAWLLACQARFVEGTLTEASVTRLLHLSAQRAGEHDETLRMYVQRHFRPLFEYVVAQGWHAERAQSVLEPLRRDEVLELTLLSTEPGAALNGRPLQFDLNAAVLTAYLAQRPAGLKVTPEELHREVYGANFKKSTIPTKLSRYRSRVKQVLPQMQGVLAGRAFADSRVQVTLDVEQPLCRVPEQLIQQLEQWAPLSVLSAFEGEWVRGVRAGVLRRAVQAVDEAERSGASPRALMELRLLLVRLDPESDQTRGALERLLHASDGVLTLMLVPMLEQVQAGEMRAETAVALALRAVRSQGVMARVQVL